MVQKRKEFDIEQVVADFLITNSYRATAKKFNAPQDSIAKALKGRGFFTTKGKIRYKEKFPEDERILGYICGFIATDGCLISRRTDIKFSNLFKDGKTIEWIADQLLEKRPKFSKNGNMYGFRGTLPKLYQYCLDMGITPNKSLTLNVNLDDKSEEFKWYFLRGCIDGDGCIYIGRFLSSSSIRISSASEDFVKCLQKHFGGSLSSESPKRSHIFGREYIPQTMWRWYLCGSATLVETFLPQLPVDDFMLERKNEKIKQFYTFSKYKNQKLYDWHGGILTLKQICFIMNVEEKLVQCRLSEGWDLHTAVYTPRTRHLKK